MLFVMAKRGESTMVNYITDPFTVIQTAGEDYIGADEGEDTTYFITSSLIQSGDLITILDEEGSNTIQLQSGLAISSSIIANDEAVLYLTNGAQINIRGASSFTFDVGGNDTLADVIGEEKTFAEFVEQDLGLSVPAEGEAPVQGGGVVIGVDNEPPVAMDDVNLFQVNTGESITIDVADLLANDTDADGNLLTVTEVNQLNPDDGSAVLSDDGLTITFTAADGFLGFANFSYKVSDGIATDIATVTLEVVSADYITYSMEAGGVYMAVDGVAEQFVYEIDSSSGSVLSAEGADLELHNFNPNEDRLVFDDVETGTTTTASFPTDVIVSESAIFNKTDIIFDPDPVTSEGFQLTLMGIVDQDLSSIDFYIA